MRVVGTVMRSMNDGAYGWIRRDGEGFAAIFCHAHDLGAAVVVGERIEFEVRETPRGLRAHEPRLLSSAAADGLSRQLIDSDEVPPFVA